MQQPVGRCADHPRCVQMISQAELSRANRMSPLAGSRGGFRVLEWTGSLVPQGTLVKGEHSLSYTASEGKL